MIESIPLQLGEEIRSVQGYEGLYSITSHGRVWSHEKIRKFGNHYRIFRAKFLKRALNRYGYLYVIFCRDSKTKAQSIHRLVAQAFIPNPLNLPQVNHKDGNKKNNHVGNLEWCTNRMNINHAMVNKLRHKVLSKYYGVTHCKEGKSKAWRSKVEVNKKRINLGRYRTEIEAAKAYNDYVIEHNLNRPLNDINKKKYLKEVEESKKLKRKYKGICHRKNKINPWKAQIKVKGRQIYLGYYLTEIEAAKAYNDYVIKHNLNRSLNNIIEEEG